MTELPQIKMQDQHPKKVPLVRTEATATTHARLEHATEAEPKDGGNHCYKYLKTGSLKSDGPNWRGEHGFLSSSAGRRPLPAPESLSHTEFPATDMCHVICHLQGEAMVTLQTVHCSHELLCSAATRTVPHDTALPRSPSLSTHSGTAHQSQSQHSTDWSLRHSVPVTWCTSSWELCTVEEAEFSRRYVHLVELSPRNDT